MTTSEIRDVLDDFAASYWLKDALRELMQRDALDAARDAELLARLMRERLEAILSASEEVSGGEETDVSDMTEPRGDARYAFIGLVGYDLRAYSVDDPGAESENRRLIREWRKMGRDVRYVPIAELPRYSKVEVDEDDIAWAKAEIDRLGL